MSRLSRNRRGGLPWPLDVIFALTTALGFLFLLVVFVRYLVGAGTKEPSAEGAAGFAFALLFAAVTFVYCIRLLTTGVILNRGYLTIFGLFRDRAIPVSEIESVDPGGRMGGSAVVLRDGEHVLAGGLSMRGFAWRRRTAVMLNQQLMTPAPASEPLQSRPADESVG